jgi:hypothetical protein
MRRMGQAGSKAKQFSAAHRQRHHIQYRSAATPPLVQPQRQASSSPGHTRNTTSAPNDHNSPPPTTSPNAGGVIQRNTTSGASGGSGNTTATPQPPDNSVGLGTTANALDASITDDSNDTSRTSNFNPNEIAERVYQLWKKDLWEKQRRTGRHQDL